MGPGAFFAASEAGPRWFPLLVVGGLEPCRAVAKRWYWPDLVGPTLAACSSWLLKILKAKFKKSL